MTFAAPWALIGLVLAATPILLHLVRRRDPPERAFPAIQYLSDATREHRRRLRLRHWLLLLCRTVLILALVAAAAGPQLSRRVPLGRHAPLAAVIVLDNSASSAAVVDGAPTLELLTTGAREVLARATPADRLWLLLADGVARPGTASELVARLDNIVVMPTRLDLGAAVAEGQALVEASGRSGEVIVITDAQASAITPLQGAGGPRVLVLRPAGEAPHNRAVADIDAGAQPWGPDGGQLALAVSADDTAAVPLRVAIDGEPPRDLLVTPGVPTTMRSTAPPPGWRSVRASLPPDELRLDDSRWAALRVAPPVAVQWDADDRFVAAALEVLTDAGRVHRGNGVRVGSLGPGASIVQPPDDPALIGALNRQLASRGSEWRYGLIDDVVTFTDSNAYLPERIRIERRVMLEATTPEAEVLVSAAGTPWLVRSGNLVLVGSRFEPEWTSLPVTAVFVPLLDRLATRTVRGEPPLDDVAAGIEFTLPSRADAVQSIDGTRNVVEGGAPWRPAEVGLYWLLAGTDTLGAVSAAVDPRESRLNRASDDAIAAAWPGAVIADPSVGASRSFTSGGRGDLRPLLLLLALACLVGESILAGRRRPVD